MEKWYFFVALLMVCVQKGTPLRCYECISLLADECSEDFEADGVSKVTCDNEDDVCMIHTSPEVLDIPEIVHRGCIDPYYCNRAEEVIEHCVTCQEDLCNSSFATFPSCVTIIFLGMNYLIM